MQQGNVFNKKKSGLLARSKSVSTINVNYSLNSIDKNELNFNNFLSSKECKEYLLLEKYFKRIQNGDISFLDKDFETNNYTTHNKEKNQRLKDLIFETSNTTLTDQDLLDVLKYKHKEKKGVQFFIKYDNSSNVGNIYLIDLYHMVIPTEQRVRDYIIKTPPKVLYRRILQKVKNRINLSELKIK